MHNRPDPNAEPARLIRARHVVPVDAPAIEDAAIEIRGGLIAEVGRWKDSSRGPHEDLGDCVVFPAFVNAHCHLDYSAMRGAILPPTNFAAWIARINDLKRTLSDEDYIDSIRDGASECRATGTGTVLNIESFPEILSLVGETGIRIYWFLEMLDIRSRITTDDLVRGSLSFFDKKGLFGLSPHAPYTTSPILYLASAECCRLQNMPLSTHLAETWEEFDMFVSGQGPLFSMLETLGRDMSDVPGETPVARILGSGLVPDGAILAHMNCLAESDWEIVAKKSRTFSVAHCPCCHAYFGREPFPLGRFLDLGVNVCLGTDSLASNRSLSMFDEIRAVLQSHPHLPPAQALHMATRAGALAVGGAFGAIRPGFAADLIAVPCTEGDPIDAIVSHRSPPHWVARAS